MLVLLDPLFVTLDETRLSIVDCDVDEKSGFWDLAVVQQKAVAWQMVAFRRLMLTVLNRYEAKR